MHPQSCEESELDARHPHARRAHDASVHCRWPCVQTLWRVYQQRATSSSDAMSERVCLSPPSLPPPSSALPPLTVERLRYEHCRRMMHLAALRTAVPLHTPHLQPATAAVCNPRTSQLALHAPFTCCDVYDNVRCDPSDGAGAGVTHDTREVRGPRWRRWERSRRERGLGV